MLETRRVQNLKKAEKLNIISAVSAQTYLKLTTVSYESSIGQIDRSTLQRIMLQSGKS